jgi:hypothetical protein
VCPMPPRTAIREAFEPMTSTSPGSLFSLAVFHSTGERRMPVKLGQNW